MSTVEHKEIVSRLVEEAFSQGDLDVVDELLAPDSVGHAYPDELHGPAEVKGFVSTFRSAFPDLQFEVRDLIAEGDKVVARWVARGTHEGEFNGIAPTGRGIEMTGITIERIEDGRVVEGWTNRDALGMLQQLGVVPTPGEASEARP